MSNKIELLAPAGSFEALVAAVQNGCDALYLGGALFGARAFANNFNEEEMKRAIRYAHRFGVRVYVTVNTLIKEDEMEVCLNYIEYLQEIDVDALIIQDIGLLMRVHQRFPDLELHASTQMHIHNPQGIKLLQEMGAKRVVVPRETTIEEIATYATLGVDLEVFVQGALCVSYSGQCYMSALTLNRSGNRGACAQNCRMQYDLEVTHNQTKQLVKTRGKYLLSPKDLNTLDYVPRLIQAGITSFKIEGRMKRPEYVALMVSSYRKAIDAFQNNKKFYVDEHIQEEMEKIFNRGFSAGHLFHDMGSKLMSEVRPNHMGITIGYISGFHQDKVMIHLHKELRQGDGIRIITSRGDEGFTINRIYKEGLLVNHGDAGDTIEIDKTFFVEKGSSVVKTSDCQQLKQLQESYAGIKKRIPIHARFTMQTSSLACLEVWDDEGFYVKQESDVICEKAHTNPLGKQRIQSQLEKSKDTPFVMKDIEYQLDGDSILPIKELNQLRRNALEELSTLREIRYHGRRVSHQGTLEVSKTQAILPYYIVIHTKEQYEVCKEIGVTSIYVDDHALYETLKEDEHVFERTSRVMKTTYSSTHVMIGEHGGLYAKQPVICDTSCNVTNHDSANVMFSRNAIGVCFSLESSLEECCEIQQQFYEEQGYYGNFIYPIYGREELMISQHCIINAQLLDSDKKHCTLCKQGEYALLDLKKHRYPIQCDDACRMHILNEHPRHRLGDIQQAKLAHITSFLLVFTKENKAQCRMVLKELGEEISL